MTDMNHLDVLNAALSRLEGNVCNVCREIDEGSWCPECNKWICKGCAISCSVCETALCPECGEAETEDSELACPDCPENARDEADTYEMLRGER